MASTGVEGIRGPRQQRRQPQQRTDDRVACGRSAAAGGLIYFVGYGWTFAIDGLSYFAVLAGLWTIRPHELRAAPVTPRAKGQVRAGLRYVSVGSVIGALVPARRTEVAVHDVVLAAAAFGATMVVLAAVPSLPFAFPAGLLLGGASIAFMTASTSIVRGKADPTMRGRVALQSMVFLG